MNKCSRLSEEWEKLFDSINDAVSIHDKDFNLVRVNRAFCRMFNKTENDLIGKKCYEIIHGADKPVPYCPHIRIVESSKPCSKEFFDQHTGIYMQVSTSPVVDRDGNMEGSVHIIKDISDRMLLSDTDNKFRTFYENAPLGYQSLDADGNILMVNSAWLGLLGYSGEEVIGKSFIDFIVQKDLFQERFPKFKEAGITQGVEFTMIRKDGGHVTVSIDGRIAYDANGNFIQTHCILKDITEYKKMEDELRALSLTDELTGLHNRRGFTTLAEQYLKLVRRQGKGIFMLYADLDQLKAVNDQYGDIEGDNALIIIANILRETYRESDIIARIGGDEFVVIPVGFAGDSVNTIITRLQDRLDQVNSLQKRSYNLSLSVGVAFYDPQNPCALRELLTRADTLMYEAKMQKRKSQP